MKDMVCAALLLVLVLSPLAVRQALAGPLAGPADCSPHLADCGSSADAALACPPCP